MNSQEPSSGVFRKILFCTDFSENADFAFDYALILAKQNPDCQLYLMHVVPESEAQFWKSYIYEVNDVDQKAKLDIEARLNSTYRQKIPPQIPLHTVFKVGKDYQEILRFAKESQADLIVIGRRGKGIMQKTFFGNVAEKVARQAPCAVLIIPLSYQKKIAAKG